VVVMAFDEAGQARQRLRRKVEICTPPTSLTEKAGITPQDIIFDPNILNVARGMENPIITRWISLSVDTRIRHPAPLQGERRRPHISFPSRQQRRA